MTSIKFSDSVIAALEFATKVMNGSINFHPDYGSADLSIKKVEYRTEYFDSEQMSHVRVTLGELYTISGLEASMIVDAPSGLCPGSKTRRATIFGKSNDGKEMPIFTLTLTYECRDEHESVPSWYVETACAHHGNVNFILDSVRTEFGSSFVTVWGQFTQSLPT